MRKAVITVVFFSMLFAIFTAATNLAVDGKKGSSAPVFKFENNDTVVFIDKMKGEWVLLQFWASTDAKSRIDMQRYAAIESHINSSEKCNFRHVGVNLDSNESLFKEIVRRDGIASNTQFYADGNRAERLKEAYHINQDGFGAFLIDPQGKIVAKNPTREQLLTLTKKGS
ncbi:MAG: thioredoxin family protein [Muribaculum sp.]|nr:thioredoxin family protein [Muribaculaceae bacterium]MCM1080616.1 thioredoxin family protein [Muribaculum sp.]